MKTVYLIPSPDMDDRAIEAIQVPNVEFVRMNLPKLQIGTDLSDCICALNSQIYHDKPILLGFCYGGLLAIELAKKIEVEKVIIVSSIKDYSELAPSRRMLAWLFYHTPERLLSFIGQATVAVINDLLRSEIKIPRIWLKSSQNKFIVKHALEFCGREAMCQIISIHGADDFVIPLRSASEARVVIQGAGHYMFVKQRKEVLEAIAVGIFGV